MNLFSICIIMLTTKHPYPLKNAIKLFVANTIPVNTEF